MRRKIYLRIGGVLLIAVVVTVVVAQTVVVEDSGWTGGILALVLSVVGILVLSGVAVGALLEGLVFSKITKLTEQVRILEGTSTEQERRSLAETLEELQTRHSDLETAYCQLQQLQEASASLGSSLDISDALVQLEEVALGIFDADEVWLLTNPSAEKAEAELDTSGFGEVVDLLGEPLERKGGKTTIAVDPFDVRCLVLSR